MDRALKERITGAVVLVVFVVLVVPVFLDGPPGDAEVVSKRVPLPGQSEQPTQTIVLDRDRSEPVPASASELRTPAPAGKETDDMPAQQPSVVQTKQEQPAAREASEAPPSAKDAERAVKSTPQPKMAAAARPVPSATEPSSATGMWAVQLGSFSNQQNAEKLAADLRKQGYAAFLSQLPTDNGSLHRVRVGPQKDRESAEAMAARLEKAGQKGQVVPHP